MMDLDTQPEELCRLPTFWTTPSPRSNHVPEEELHTICPGLNTQNESRGQDSAQGVVPRQLSFQSLEYQGRCCIHSQASAAPMSNVYPCGGQIKLKQDFNDLMTMYGASEWMVCEIKLLKTWQGSGSTSPFTPHDLSHGHIHIRRWIPPALFSAVLVAYCLQQKKK